MSSYSNYNVVRMVWLMINQKLKIGLLEDFKEFLVQVLRGNKRIRLVNIPRYVRRLYLWHFRRDYIYKSIAERKGECRSCGCCVDRATSCKHYDKVRKLCGIWNGIPLFCKLYPIDEKDKKEFSKKYCGYYWGKL